MNGQSSGVDYINDDNIGSTTYFDNNGGSYSNSYGGGGYGITNMSRTNILNNLQCDPKMKPLATQKCTTGIDCAPSKLNEDNEGSSNNGESSGEENVENNSKNDSNVSVEQPVEKTDGVQEYEDGEVEEEEDDDEEDENEGEGVENDKVIANNPTETRTGEIIRGINTDTGIPVMNADVSFESYGDISSEEAKQEEEDPDVEVSYHITTRFAIIIFTTKQKIVQNQMFYFSFLLNIILIFILLLTFSLSYI